VHRRVHQVIVSVSRPVYLDSEFESPDRHWCFRAAAHWKSKIWQGPTKSQGGRPCKKSITQAATQRLGSYGYCTWKLLLSSTWVTLSWWLQTSRSRHDVSVFLSGTNFRLVPYFILPDSAMIGTWTSLQVRIGGNFRCIRERLQDVLYCCHVTALLSYHSASLPHHMRCC
jgi:hypothetical protein